MTDDLLIRPSAESDLSAIQRIYAHHVLHGVASFEEEPPDLTEMARRRESVLMLGLPHLVAEGTDGVLGYAYAGTYRPRPAYRYTVEDSIYVAPGLAGRGVGSALLSRLISDCEKGPWRQMIAVIGDSGNAGSIALHRRFGFTLTGTFHSIGFKHGRWLDSVLMQRPLGPGDQTPPG
ncbi:N-acetyltransferase [Haematobacter massiliensis]|uniref:GCN5 family acetyltransferase n=1 Tax=Haematobacter massiliensis TaxID=195105 RepID=A0A086Y0C6_9RHOB|nr:GNAT family N-acetyltransferase [Haematobacter massiliensis]KFI27726.1 GCN5 family acetyltransferase [Haematobacter massiliensis]OWJ71853.1 N-acetyltransferase [Haematobacter massiliensis]OWJ83110.1 N-acetyltransferase [Haematobacter massiliensis]QBJ23928.1 N-acetyltransferase [Haematobacter massiliensis]